MNAPDDYAPAGPLEKIRARIAARRPWWRRLADQMKRDVPGVEPGTPPHPTAEKEPTVHTLMMENTARGRRIAAALALAHIEEAGLPETEWKITRDGDLHGHIDIPTSDTEARRSIDHFAEFLGGPVSGRRSVGRLTEWTHLSTEGLYRGVRVDVWAHVEVRPLDHDGSPA